MKYDFEEYIDRRGNASLKWDFSKRFTGLEEVLPLWVADMDFACPVEVKDALKTRTEHGIYGYTLEPDSYYEAVIDWMKRRHNWEIRRGWMTACHGVVPSINLALLAFSRPGDKVVLQPPVYYPFMESIANNGRRIAENPLRIDRGKYSIDFEHLEKLIDERTRILLLCSPHNPVGRVWRAEELERLVEICSRRNVVILSDEIHHDLILDGFRHLPTAALSKEAARITVTFTAATKTFNLAGVGCSMTIIADDRLRRLFQSVRRSLWTELANAFSITAAEAAYRCGEPWLEQILGYIEKNYEFLKNFFAERLPEAVVFPLEGTYLAWIDLRSLGYSDDQLKERILKRAGVWLDDGPMFGTGGEGFQRINIACPRSILEKALEKIVKALV